MSSPVCGTEGMLTIRLGLDAGRIAAVKVESTRPLGVARIFLGKPVGEALATLPLLYSVCATAQAAAAVAAVEVALCIRPSEPQRRAREALLLAETAREHLVRCLLGWGTWLGERPDPRALALTGRLRGGLATALYPESDGFRPGGGRLSPNSTQLAKVLDTLELVLTEVVLGVPPQTWLETGDAAGLATWAAEARSMGARTLAQVAALGWSDLASSAVLPLGETTAGELEPWLVGPGADAFIARPVWDGQPRETGALAREIHRPLIADLNRHHGNGLLTRLTARLSELAALPGRIAAALEGLGPDTAPSQPPSDGASAGIGQVEAARGRLVHRVEIESGVIRGYRILAPTEWNFHPDGVLARGLDGPACRVGPERPGRPDRRGRGPLRRLPDSEDPGTSNRPSVLIVDDQPLPSAETRSR